MVFDFLGHSHRISVLCNMVVKSSLETISHYTCFVSNSDVPIQNPE